MPAILAALVPLLIEWVAKLLLALGVSFIAYKGLDKFVERVSAFIMNELGGLPSDMLQLFNLAGGGEALNIIFGAFSSMVVLMATHRTISFFGGKK